MVVFLLWPTPLTLDSTDGAVWRWVTQLSLYQSHHLPVNSTTAFAAESDTSTDITTTMCERHFYSFRCVGDTFIYRKDPLTLLFCTQGLVRLFMEIKGSWCQYKLYLHQVSGVPAVQPNCPSQLNFQWTLSLRLFLDFISPLSTILYKQVCLWFSISKAVRKLGHF